MDVEDQFEDRYESLVNPSNLTVAEVKASRVKGKAPTLIDEVEQARDAIWDDDEDFRKLHDPIKGRAALYADVRIAMAIQKVGVDKGFPLIKAAEFHEIIRAHKMADNRVEALSRPKRLAVLKRLAADIG